MWDDLAVPDEAVSRQYYDRGWWRERTFTDDLAAAARDRGSHPALVAYEQGELARSLTYRELAALVERAAAGLVQLGVSRGDVVLVYLPNLWPAVVMYLACHRIGAVAAPLRTSMAVRELEYVLTSSQAVLSVAMAAGGPGGNADLVAQAAPPTLKHQVVIGGDPDRRDVIDFATFFEGTAWEERHLLDGVRPSGPDEPSLLVYSSGTTGRMKGVVHSQNTLYAAGRGLAEPFGLDGSTVVTVPHYFTHLAGALIGVYMPILTGGTTIIQHPSNDMDALLDLIERHQISYLYAAPGYVVGMLASQQDRPRDLSSLRQFISGSAPIRPELIEQAREVLGVNLGALWGMTETGCSTITRPDDPPGWAVRSDGRPVEWMQIKLRDGDTGPGVILDESAAGGPDRPTGELLIRGPALCLGYLGMAEKFRSCLDDEGWFDTGDLAREDGRGGIKIVGRRVDMITRAIGQKVSTLEVELVMDTHPNVAEAVLIGYPDPAVPGVELAAAVVIAKGCATTLADLHKYLDSEGLARFMWPDRLIHIRELPRNSLGKVDRAELRQRLATAAAPAGGTTR
jgi:cyclohexanecarboxylate-CoA ligase